MSSTWPCSGRVKRIFSWWLWTQKGKTKIYVDPDFLESENGFKVVSAAL
ncbi:hypothetical Protein YC6258_01355 [Gynuella sunshinyii YC6258]|uniref:Uncharacterized protein n=1 Tax=Gynuella sunshinyii YC6258 TaxID=1445510 RepID=A0A0C5VJ30_9GAMM|nr:hypothetical Protein YC6258_01355 [Gynuella sunshinyii YC6258]